MLEIAGIYLLHFIGLALFRREFPMPYSSEMLLEVTDELRRRNILHIVQKDSIKVGKMIQTVYFMGTPGELDILTAVSTSTCLSLPVCVDLSPGHGIEHEHDPTHSVGPI